MEAMDLYRFIRRQAAAVVSGAIPLDEFVSRYVPASWSIGADAPSWLREVAGSIDLALAEYSNGHRDLSDLLSLIRSAVIVPPTDTVVMADGDGETAPPSAVRQSARVVTLKVTMRAA